MKQTGSKILRTLQAGLLVSLLVFPQVSRTAQTEHTTQNSPPGSPVIIDFRDIASEAGLTAENVSGDADSKRYILETTGNGVAIFDVDNDGLMDIFAVNATTMDGKGRGEKSTSHLYRNLGKSAFFGYHAASRIGKSGMGPVGFAWVTTTTMALKICS